MGDLVGEIVASSFNYKVIKLGKRQRAKLSKKFKKVRKAMLKVQEEQRKELPFASGETMIKRFEAVV